MGHSGLILKHDKFFYSILTYVVLLMECSGSKPVNQDLQFEIKRWVYMLNIESERVCIIGYGKDSQEHFSSIQVMGHSSSILKYNNIFLAMLTYIGPKILSLPHVSMLLPLKK